MLFKWFSWDNFMIRKGALTLRIIGCGEFTSYSTSMSAGHITFQVWETRRPLTTSKSGSHSIFSWPSISFSIRFTTTGSKNKRMQKRKLKLKKHSTWTKCHLPTSIPPYSEVTLEMMSQWTRLKLWIPVQLVTCSDLSRGRRQSLLRASIMSKNSKSNGLSFSLIPTRWDSLVSWRKNIWLWTSRILKDQMFSWTPLLCSWYRLWWLCASGSMLRPTMSLQLHQSRVSIWWLLDSLLPSWCTLTLKRM